MQGKCLDCTKLALGIEPETEPWLIKWEWYDEDEGRSSFIRLYPNRHEAMQTLASHVSSEWDQKHDMFFGIRRPKNMKQMIRTYYLIMNDEDFWEDYSIVPLRHLYRFGL